MRFGCAWYPEHWSKDRWPDDLALMRAAGMNVVRVGEFAWSRLEPNEGAYDFDWLEEAIDAAARYGLDTVIGTPTAAPPAWLTRRYPEVLLVREDGRTATHGNRCHFSPASDRYRTFCVAIARALGTRFGKHPRVIGWQIDNEYHVAPYGEEARHKFHEFLRLRYGDLASLNQRWTTDYWSQTYTEWDQIPLPVGDHNPGLMLEFRRFVGHTYAEYQRAQIEVIRPHSHGFVTHNSMGWFEAWDHDLVYRDLDLASWDGYVGGAHLDPLEMGAKHDTVRGLKRQNFWLMETQPGAVNWARVNCALNRGEARTLAWQAIGHGADAILYWQWRSALNGQEQYHGSLLGADGRPRPIYGEIRRLGQELARVAEILRGSSPSAECAMLDSYDDRWALQLQRHHADFDPGAHFTAFYRALRRQVHTVDVLHPTASLDGYGLVVAPHLHVLESEIAQRLEGFVRRGGHLVLGPRSGVKDASNALLPSRPPGPLAPLLGGHVEEYYALEAAVPIDGGGEARIWAEMLEPDANEVEVVGRYGPCNGWLDGRPAVLRRQVDRGQITYVGAWVDEATLNDLATTWIASSGVQPTLTSSDVEVCRRVGESTEVWICINHSRATRDIELPFAGTDRLTGEHRPPRFCLGPYDVAVVVRKQSA